MGGESGCVRTDLGLWKKTEWVEAEIDAGR
jgi:hypothetical protein